MEPDAADEQDIPTQQLDRKFIFYEPGKSRIPDPRPVWQRLIDDRLGDNATLSKRFQVQQLLRLLPRGPEVNPICTASRLASTLSTNPDERKVQQLLISILCDILYTSGRSTPEEIDSVIGTFSSKSSSTKYLEKIRRAGTTANELIIEWARSSNGDSLDRLDCATQTILQAGLSLPQWCILYGNRKKVREHITTRPLPKVPPSTGTPLLIPCVMVFLANGSVKISEICRRLGYDKPEFMNYIVELPLYQEMGLVRHASDPEEACVESGSSTEDKPA